MPRFILTAYVKERLKWLKFPIMALPEALWSHRRISLSAFNHPNPEMSIVTIARNKDKQILCTLAKAAEPDVSFPAELLVMNNDSTDCTTEILGKSDFKYSTEKKVGAGVVRQLVWNQTNGSRIKTGDTDTLYTYDRHIIITEPNKIDATITVTYAMHVLHNNQIQYPSGQHPHQYRKHIHKYLHGLKRPHLNFGRACMTCCKADADKAWGDTDLAGREAGTSAHTLSKHGEVKIKPHRQASIFTGNHRMRASRRISKAFSIRKKNNSLPCLSILHHLETSKYTILCCNFPAFMCLKKSEST